MTSVPLADYALLSDCRSAALVSREGSVDWLCCPRFDAPSVFARILDHDAGHFAIRPVGEATVSRRYLDQTMVLETAFATPAGTAVLVDALAVGRNDRGHHLGAGSPGTLLRGVACTAGSVELAVEYAPRPEYGIVRPLLAAVDGGVDARGGADRLLLSTPVPLDVGGSTATGRLRLGAGDTAGFALQHRQSWSEPKPWGLSQAEIARDLAATTEAWRSWSALHQTYEGPWRHLVHQSGRVLQALTYQPTGAIVAAPTTSLPESVGNARNWDYRYTWVRDACLTMEALWLAACPDEANKFFGFLAGAATQLHDGGDLQIMFGIGGERDLTERPLPHLAGWRESRPVRVGNGAWTQRQLDVYGELLRAAERLVDQFGTLDPAVRRFLTAATDTAAARWRERDHGIWEVRGEPRDFLHSKLLCWSALDRAIALAPTLGATDRVGGWIGARDEIRAAILDRGWSDRAGAYTQSFGSDELDASSLMLALTGFLPAGDPRMRATIEAVADRLTDERGLVYRYRADDGLGGEEGTFLLCTFWLAHALALAGEVGRARETFERAAACVNDVGLLAEEVDPASGEMIGNYPQAFSHVGLVNAAWAISRAERRQAASSRS